ncbi:MAG TPA: CopD family protein [Anaerolineales bacterium]|nr:CopD family protein [Anaerolineales bacterium]
MSAPSTTTLAVIYWLHMLATVIWIGSLAAINLLVLPASTRTLKMADQLSFISALQKRLEPLAWFCMGILVVTGLFQMSTSPHYNGFLSISTQWSLSILVKHGFAVIMVVVSAIQTWDVLPAIQRTLMKKDQASEEELARLQKKELLILRVNLALSILILGATAFARVS